MQIFSQTLRQCRHIDPGPLVYCKLLLHGIVPMAAAGIPRRQHTGRLASSRSALALLIGCMKDAEAGCSVRSTLHQAQPPLVSHVPTA